MIVSDAPNCGVTYDRHYGNCNSFIIQATSYFLDETSLFHLTAVIGTAHFEKCKQLLEYQNLLLLSDIWWLKF